MNKKTKLLLGVFLAALLVSVGMVVYAEEFDYETECMETTPVFDVVASDGGDFGVSPESDLRAKVGSLRVDPESNPSAKADILREHRTQEKVDAVNLGQKAGNKQGNDSINPEKYKRHENQPPKKHSNWSKPPYLPGIPATRVYRGVASHRAVELQGGYSFDNRSVHGLAIGYGE